MIYETIYRRLDALLISEGGLKGFMSHEPGYAVQLRSRGYMALHVNFLGENTLSLSHYYTSNGDMVPDPDMQVRVVPEMKMAEAMTYQDSMRYQEVYPEPGKYYPKLKKQLNSFLVAWLRNLKNQGFFGKSNTREES